MSTLIIGAITFGLLGLATMNLIKKSKTKEGTCGCGCSGCPSKSNCNK